MVKNCVAGNMITTGKKERLSVRKGSEIEFSPEEIMSSARNVLYCGILEQNLGRSKKTTSLSVRCLDPLLKQDFSPPIIKTTVLSLIRPVPPPDPFPDVDFEVGDVIDAVHNGGWWAGSVIKVLRNQRYFVYLDNKPGAIEVERKNLRPHMIWERDEWFRREKRPLVETDFSKGAPVEVRTEVDKYGEVWSKATVIKENEDGNLQVKLLSFSPRISVPYSKIRPSQPVSSGIQTYKLMEKVEACVNHTWCPGLVSKLPHGDQYQDQYVVVLGPNKEIKKITSQHLRPSLEWKDGVWFREEDKLLESEESPHEGKTTPNALATDQEMRETHSSGDGAVVNPTRTSSNGVDVAETGKVSVAERETTVLETVAHLTGELGSKLSNTVIQENTPVTKQPEIGGNKEFHSPVDLGIDATLTTPVDKTQGKTYLRKKLQGMNVSANDSDGEKEPEQTKETLGKRKRGEPPNLISTEPKQKTGMPNSFVEKSDDFVETPPSKEPMIVLPFAKTLPLWKVFESMEVFKIAPQYPHFGPLLEKREEFREGDAFGSMMTYIGLLKKLNNLQVDDPISDFNNIDECFLDLEKHGFNITKARSRIAKLLSIKERQTWTSEKSDVVDEKIIESDNKRRKCEEDIVKLQIEFQRREAVLKEEKVRLDKEIEEMQSYAAVLDQEAQNIDQGFRTIAAAPLL